MSMASRGSALANRAQGGIEGPIAQAIAGIAEHNAGGG